MSSTLRSRPATAQPPKNKPSTSSPSPSENPTRTSSDSHDLTHLSLLDILRILSGLLLLSTTLSYYITSTLTWNYRPPITRPAQILAWLRGPLHLTDAQLSFYNGTDASLPIYLALNGTIYDVSASPHLYGPGGSYAFFAGRDATRAFVTGCFGEDLTGDLRGVEEMFMPVEDEAGGGGGVGIEDGGAGTERGGGTTKYKAETKEEKRERKLRREREVRVARKKVRETVDGWRRMFDGGKGGKYFRVGRVERGEGSGWKGWGKRTELCESARKGRPRKTAAEV